MIKINAKAQNLVEYALVLLVVATILITLQGYITRGIQGHAKPSGDILAHRAGGVQMGRAEEGLTDYTQVNDFEVTHTSDIDIEDRSDGSYQRKRIVNKDATERHGKWITEGRQDGFEAYLRTKGSYGASESPGSTVPDTGAGEPPSQQGK